MLDVLESDSPICSRWYRLFRLQIFEDHIILSVFQSGEATNLSTQERIACLHLYIVAVMATAALLVTHTHKHTQTQTHTHTHTKTHKHTHTHTHKHTPFFVFFQSVFLFIATFIRSYIGSCIDQLLAHSLSNRWLVH